jgi:hypothetical protein
MKSETIATDEIMVSFDVISLFTSIPIELAISVVKERLDLDTTLSTRTNLSKANIMILLKFVLDNCFFQCNSSFYQQIFGCPMGSPISALLANLVMEHVEEEAIRTSNNPPKWWYRYVDDSHCCLKKDYVQDFHQHLNSINNHIQFTYEQEDDENGLAFLDTKTTRSEEGKIITTVYRKPTHTERYLDFNSHHPMTHKRSVATTLLRRATSIPSNSQERDAELQHVKEVLKTNNYPDHFIKKCEQSQSISYNQNTNNTFIDETIQPTITLPYISGVAEKITRTLKSYGIKTAHKPMAKMNSFFPRQTSTKDENSIKEVVYKIDCSDCHYVYYGQTERALKTRLKEHKRAIVNNLPSSKIAQHANNKGHEFNFNETKIVDREKDWHKRLFLEAWHSELDENSENDHIAIPKLYKIIVNSKTARA